MGIQLPESIFKLFFEFYLYKVYWFWKKNRLCSFLITVEELGWTVGVHLALYLLVSTGLNGGLINLRTGTSFHRFFYLISNDVGLCNALSACWLYAGVAWTMGFQHAESNLEFYLYKVYWFWRKNPSL